VVVTEAALVLRPAGGAGAEPGGLVAAHIACVRPLPDVLRTPTVRLVIGRAGCEALESTASALVVEAAHNRCGGAAVAERLAEALFVLALRRAIETGVADSGLLAALADARLHRALTAFHDAPDRPWTVDSLAETAGMSRSRFTARFAQVMGDTPMGYVSGWRMAEARAALGSGAQVKSVARRAGFGSTAAFSRAWRRRFGTPPTSGAREP
jgi:transcriptional regulator GlxA family with amidase domain